jgi:hypothetical protein
MSGIVDHRHERLGFEVWKLDPGERAISAQPTIKSP